MNQQNRQHSQIYKYAVTTNTLSSLAMLKVSIDTGGDYLSYLNPYVIHILAKEPQESQVTENSIGDKLRETFGLEIPSQTVQLILRRFAKQKLLVLKNHIYTINKQSLPEDHIPKQKAEVDRHIARITNELKIFAQTQSNRNLDDEQAHFCIIAFLEQFSIPFLRLFLRGTTLPSLPKASSEDIVLVARFVKQINEKPELLSSFEKLVEGHMLANALLCPDLNEVSDNYSRTTFFLDTALVLQVLGFEEKQKQDAAKELVSLISNLKGTVSYFSHTLEEVQNVIGFAIKHLNAPEYISPTILASRKKELTISDLILKKENIETDLSALGIKLTQTPPYNLQNKQFNIGEVELENLLKNQVQYRGDNAASYDVKSIRGIYILRKGTISVSVEKSISIFVTNNTAVAKASRQYEERIEMSNSVPSVITDFSLANMAWLKSPQGAPSLPRKEILAFAYAASLPTPNFWEKVLSEAEKLEKQGKISTRDHQLLRSNQAVIDELMGLTLGNDVALTEQTIADTVNRVSAEIKKEETERLNSEIIEHNRTKDSLESQKNQLEEIKKKCFWSCENKARRESQIILWGGWLIIVVIAGASVARLFQYNSVWIELILFLEIVLSAVGWKFDLSPNSMCKKFADWRKKKLYQKECTKLCIPLSEETKV